MKLTLACLLVLALVASAACTQTVEAPPANGEEAEAPLTSTTPPDTAEDEEAPPPATVTEEDIEAARQVVFTYLDALNNYDLEGVLACMEESWGQEREASLTSEIGQMETFGVTLGVEEEAEPAINADETIEIKIKLDVPMPMPDRHVTYQLMKIDGEWKICFAE